MNNLKQKTITVEDAAYFIRLCPTRLHNLIKRGDFKDIGEYILGAEGPNRGVVLIKSAAFLEKYALTWDDVFEARIERAEQEKPEKEPA